MAQQRWLRWPPAADCLAGPLSALLQHLRDQEQHSAAEQVSASTSTAVETSAGGRLGALEGAVALRGSGLSSVPPEVWEVSPS